MADTDKAYDKMFQILRNHGQGAFSEMDEAHRVYFGDIENTCGVCHANMHLTAAAPELYAALEEAAERLNYWRSYEGDEHHALETGKTLLRIREALRKARGDVDD